MQILLQAKPATEKKENLGPGVNSRWDERAPVIAPDGKILYFTRGNHPGNTGFGQYDSEQDIWYSTLQEDCSWSEAVNIGPPLNTEYPNSVCSVTPDGNTLLLLGAYRTDGASEAGYSISVRTRSGWSIPQKLNIKNYYNYNRFAIAYLDNNGKILLLAAERLNSIGKKDIFISHNLGGNNWSEPENLGADINTSEDEYSPFLASDGKSLYFSSKGHGGSGGYDVFVSKRLDDSWAKWSKPENLGSGINSPEDDLFFKIPSKGDYVYFLSYSNSYGEGDIFRAMLPDNLRPQPVVLLRGKVRANYTDDPLEAVIRYETLPDFAAVGTAATNPLTGEYKITLPAGRKYRFYASAGDYLAHGGEIDLSQLGEYKELESDIVLSPVEIGQVLSLDSIIFDFNSNNTEEKYKYIIDDIILLLNGNHGASIEVAGWRCETEMPGIDSDRAKKIADDIVKRYIQPCRVQYSAKGISGGRQCGKATFRIIK